MANCISCHRLRNLGASQPLCAPAPILPKSQNFGYLDEVLDQCPISAWRVSVWRENGDPCRHKTNMTIPCFIHLLMN